MKNSLIETIIGSIVIAMVVILLVFAYIKTGGGQRFINLSAEFEHVSGLNIGSEVRVSGMKIGKINDLNINPITYRVTVIFSVDSDIRLTADSIAKIEKDSILGNTSLSIEPGGNTSIYLKDGDHMTITESAISIMDLISNVIMTFTSNNKKNKLL